METHVNGTDNPVSGVKPGQARSPFIVKAFQPPMYTTPAITPIPGSIVKAICTVQASIEAIKKSQFNKHDNYKFASADDIYAALAVKLAQAGLVIYPLELDRVATERVKNAKGDERSWGKFHFGYVLATEQDTWFDPRSARSLFIQILGPQTFNAAESYCQKTYLRALFKLPTGDMDLDSLPQEEAESPKKKSAAEAKRDGTADKFNACRQQIASCTTRDALHQCKGAWLEEWSDWPNRWVEMCQDDWDVKFEELPE